jgi:protein disulfide-isomerase A6
VKQSFIFSFVSHQHNSLCGQYGIKGFPSIKVFGGNKNAPEDYNGDRTANGIVQAAQRAAMKVVQV